jgi:hypothetical protein
MLSKVYQAIQRNDSIADAVNPRDLDIYRPIPQRKWGKSTKAIWPVSS